MIVPHVSIVCDRCHRSIGEETRGKVARLARSQGWKVGRRSARSERIDLCPRCRVLIAGQGRRRA